MCFARWYGTAGLARRRETTSMKSLLRLWRFSSSALGKPSRSSNLASLDFQPYSLDERVVIVELNSVRITEFREEFRVPSWPKVRNALLYPFALRFDSLNKISILILSWSPFVFYLQMLPIGRCSVSRERRDV